MGFSKKYYPNLAWRKALYIESESKLTIKLLRNAVISRVYNGFRSCQIRQLRKYKKIAPKKGLL